MVGHLVLFRWADDAPEEAKARAEEELRVVQEFIAPIRADTPVVDYEV